MRVALASALLALALSLSSLRNGFVIDDSYLVIENPAIRSLGNLPGFFTRSWGGGAGGEGHARTNQSYYRPLTTTLQAIEYALFGLRPTGWHVVSALLHALSSALVALLALRMAGRPRVGLLGGSLFALHPVHVEAVAPACYQTTLLAAALAIAALVAFEVILRRGPRPLAVIGFALLGTAGLLAKEEAVVLPLLVIAWAIIARPPGWARTLGVALGALAIGFIPVLLVRSTTVSAGGPTFFGDASPSVVLLTMLSTAPLYLRLLASPFLLCPFYDWFIVPHQHALWGPPLVGIGVLAALAAAIGLALRHDRPVAVGLLWLPLGLLPVLQLVPILNVAAERFLYLSSVGWAIALGSLGDRLLGRAPRVAGAAIAVAWALLALRTVTRWPDWHDDVTLNLATARDFPETPTPLLNLADLAEARGDRRGALEYLDQVNRLAPGWSPIKRRLEQLRDEPPR